MKRRFAFLCVVVAVLMLGASVAWAVESYTPYRNHQGNIGSSTRVWQYGYFDNLRGDGTNATIHGFRKTVTAKTANYSVTAADCGKVFSNYGATTSVRFDMPSVSAVTGCEFTFLVSVTSSVIFEPYGTDYLKVMTNAGGDSLDNATAGSVLKVISDGYNWYPNGTAYGTWTDRN